MAFVALARRFDAQLVQLSVGFPALRVSNCWDKLGSTQEFVGTRMIVWLQLSVITQALFARFQECASVLSGLSLNVPPSLFRRPV